MLAEERQNNIVSQVNEKGSVYVKELSEQFGVTEDSIRKDLTMLEKKGLLKKTYGGAVKVRVNVHEFYVSQRKEKNIEDKQEIAKKAYALIEDGDMIFLDISTSNIELAKMLIQNERDVTVVTNMIEVMLLFMAKTSVKFLFVGGVMSEGRDGFVGALANQELEKYHFDKAFMGVVGVDLDNNRVSTYHVDDAATKTLVMSCSERAYMMLETRKFATNGNYQYAKINDFTGGIMEKTPERVILNQLKSYALQWI